MNKSIIQLKRLFEETITTLSIAEPLDIQTSLTYKDYAHRNNFDTVVFKKDVSGELHCWDRKKSIKPAPVKHADIVTDSTPLLDVVRLLVEKGRLFVFERNEIRYIVTMSDLEKMPVRIWLFGIISLTEMELKALIGSHCTDDEAISKLSPGRREKVEALYNIKAKSNIEIRHIDCLQYCDIETLLKKTPGILARFSKIYKSSDFYILSEAEKLRNVIAHSQKIEMEWDKIIKITVLLEDLLNHINIEHQKN